MSTPYTFPAGPTRLAESSTSMPPPDPRSRTVWPRSSSISAVGLPHPSEAASASAGSSDVSWSEYRFDEIGPAQAQADGPQQLLRSEPWEIERAIEPYFPEPRAESLTCCFHHYNCICRYSDCRAA